MRRGSTRARRHGDCFEPAHEARLYPDRHGDHDFAFEAATKAPEGALIGIGLGAILGAIVGLTLGILGRVPEVADLGPLGPLLLALSGATIGAILLGGIGALAGLRVPEIEAKHYEGKVRIGNILIGVHASRRAQMSAARGALRSVAASDVQTTTESSLPISSS